MATHKAEAEREIKRTPHARPGKPDEKLVEKSRTTRKVRRMGSFGVDQAWFKARLDEAGLSMRRLATRMGLDVSAVSLMLAGKRNMSVHEAGQIAAILGLPIGDVMKKAGVAELPVTAAGGSVAVSGWVDGQGRAHDGPPRGPGAIQGPLDVVGGAGGVWDALRVQEGPMDGWTLFHRTQGAAKGVRPEAVGKLCVVKVEGRAYRELAWLRPGYDLGAWRLVGMDGSERGEAKLEWASPVLWIRL